MKKYKLLRTLALIGALFGTTPKAKATGAEDNQLDIKTNAEVALFANAEKASGKKAFGDLTICPKIYFEKDGKKLGYEGSFYNTRTMDAKAQDWMTFISKIAFETEDWAGFVGRDCTRFQTAGFLNCPGTTTFSNDVRLNGTSRTLTGANLTYKPWGLELGYMANDGRMSFNHWDTVMLGYKKQFNDAWGVQFQAGGGARPLTFGGLTVAYTPDKDNAIVGEVIYKNHRTTGVLTAKHNLTDNWLCLPALKWVKPAMEKSAAWPKPVSITKSAKVLLWWEPFNKTSAANTQPTVLSDCNIAIPFALDK